MNDFLRAIFHLKNKLYSKISPHSLYLNKDYLLNKIFLNIIYYL